MGTKEHIKWQEVIELPTQSTPLSEEIISILSEQYKGRDKIPFELTTNGILVHELNKIENDGAGQEQFLLRKEHINSGVKKSRIIIGDSSEVKDGNIYISLKNPINPLSRVMIHEISHDNDPGIDLDKSLGEKNDYQKKMSDLEKYLSDYYINYPANNNKFNNLFKVFRPEIEKFEEGKTKILNDILIDNLTLRESVSKDLIEAKAVISQEDLRTLTSENLSWNDFTQLYNKFYSNESSDKDKEVVKYLDKILNQVQAASTHAIYKLSKEFDTAAFDFYKNANEIDSEWTKAFFVIKLQFLAPKEYNYKREEYSVDIENIFGILSLDDKQSIPLRHRYNNNSHADLNLGLVTTENYSRMHPTISRDYKSFQMNDVLDKYWDEIFNLAPDPEVKGKFINEDQELEFAARSMKRILADKIIDENDIAELEGIKSRLAACEITVELEDDQIRFKNYMRFVGTGEQADFKMKEGVSFKK